MNSVRNILIVIALLSISTINSVAAQERFRIMEYNVENLFDTIPEPSCDDVAFTPHGEQLWDTRRYWAKQGRLARVIAAAGGDSPVELVGMVEVENDTVLKHLTKRTSLARLGYEYIVTSGLDTRGIDVGLLYQPGRFKPIYREDLRMPVSGEERPTRDVLFVEGLLPTLDTLSVFVAHFPSRRGGKRETAPYRCRAAQVIRQKVDSIQQQRPDAYVVILGDLNDEVHDTSLQKVLKVKSMKTFETEEPLLNTSLYEPTPQCREFPGIVEGTYYYRREWSRIDHIIMSGALAQSTAKPPHLRILGFPFLLETMKSSFPVEYKPKRNYQGTFYKGGFSDHLPLMLEFSLTEQRHRVPVVRESLSISR